MIYFIQQGDDGPVKIGFSASPNDRRAALQGANSENLGLIAEAEGTLEDEACLHEWFAEHRIRGEWFRPAPVILKHAEMLRALGWMNRHQNDLVDERDALRAEVAWLREHTGCDCKCPVCS